VTFLNIKTIIIASLVYLIPACANPSPLLTANTSMEQYLNQEKEEQVQEPANNFTNFNLTSRQARSDMHLCA